MKSKLLYLLAMLILGACSSPKYAYNFDYYDYNSGKKAKKAEISASQELPAVNAQQLLASNDDAMIVDATTAQGVVAPSVEVKKTYLQMTKNERKEFKKDIKNYIKEKKESIKAAKSTNAMDNDLKLAAIFGAVGLVALIIGGDVFWIIGGIAMIIGVVFFVKWLVRQ